MEYFSGNAFTYTQTKNGYIVEYICVVNVKYIQYHVFGIV